jgi:hypothetical protein
MDIRQEMYNTNDFEINTQQKVCVAQEDAMAHNTVDVKSEVFTGVTMKI